MLVKRKEVYYIYMKYKKVKIYIRIVKFKLRAIFHASIYLHVQHLI